MTNNEIDIKVLIMLAIVGVISLASLAYNILYVRLERAFNPSHATYSRACESFIASIRANPQQWGWIGREIRKKDGSVEAIIDGNEIHFTEPEFIWTDKFTKAEQCAMVAAVRVNLTRTDVTASKLIRALEDQD